MECRRNHYDVISRHHDCLMCRVFLIALLSFILKASRKNLRKNFPENVPKYLLEKPCMEKSPEDTSLFELFDFSELLRSRRFHFPLKNYMDRCLCLNLGEHFLWSFFPLSFFVWARRKCTGKKPHKNSVNEIQAKSGEIPVRNNITKFMQNVGRLIPKSTKLTCFPIHKI